MEAPEKNLEAPQKNLEAPQKNLEAPQQNLEAPQQNLEAPQQILEVIFLFLFDWIACEAAAQLLEYLAVYLAEHHGAVHLAMAKTG